MKLEFPQRLDQNLSSFEKGYNFGFKNGKFESLEELVILNIAVDTVRQLYKGTISRQIDYALQTLTMDGAQIIIKDEINKANDINIRHFNIPFDCKISKMGKNSGYRYKLQNNEVGIIILIGSYFRKVDEEFSHLKIELSPHFISQRSPQDIHNYCENIAQLYLENHHAEAISVHLCVDVQGWEMPNHMDDHIITRSKRIRTYRGIDDIRFEGMDAVLSMYGRNETLMVGNANALQLSIYRKDIEIKKTDKVDYYHDIWESYSLGQFDKEKPVTRFEFRFHHSIIKEFERGQGEDIKTYIELEQYLNDLWLYGLKNIRYQEGGIVMPIWMILMQDIEFNSSDIRQEFKRKQAVAKTDTTAITRNLGLFLGNYLTIRCRSGIKFNQIQNEIKKMAIMGQIRDHLLESRQDEGMFFEKLKHKYLERCIASNYSVQAAA